MDAKNRLINTDTLDLHLFGNIALLALGDDPPSGNGRCSKNAVTMRVLDADGREVHREIRGTSL